MKPGKALIMALSVMALVIPGCQMEPGIDKGKFSDLNLTARELQAAIMSGKPCDLPEALLQKLAVGIQSLQDRTTSKAERDLVKAYTNLAATYHDGALLCKYGKHLSQFQFVPKGRIYVFQELDPLVQKYDLSTESHVYKPTGLSWRSIAADSINVIGKSAESQLRNIENTVNYN